MLTTQRKRLNHDDSKVNWLMRIDEAFASNRLRLYGQVIVQSTGRGNSISYPTVGFEVLLRIVDADGSFGNLAELLLAVERLQLTERIDYFVLKSVISRLKTGALFCPAGRRIFINLSGQSMGNSGFLAAVSDLILSTPAIASQLCIEITETHALRNVDAIRQFIETLKHHGCQFALDDFGSGFASFTYLKTLPVDYVKIDGSFVLGVAENPIDFAIVRSFSEIGQMMGKTIIAEWVETDVMAQRLRMIGIDRMQGHAFGHPIPLDKLVWQY